MDDQTSQYVAQLRAGPFPGRIDPWGEIGVYFQQTHSGMIGGLMDQLQDSLLARGYIASVESSLQIAGGREPDIAVHRLAPTQQTLRGETYRAAAAALQLEAGVDAHDSLDLAAIHIRQRESRRLVTIIEIVSPSNKSHAALRYRDYRAHLLEQGVNIIELDPTRSLSRLLESAATRAYPYHIAVYLPAETPLVIGVEFDAPLKRFALPLLAEVLEVDPHAAYRLGYQRAAIAGQIEADGRYHRGDLPFPSTLTPDQQAVALAQVEGWLARIAALRAARAQSD